MSFKSKPVAAVTAALVSLPALAASPDWLPLGDVFQSVSGSISISTTAGTQTAQFGPTNFGSGDGTSLVVDMPGTYLNKLDGGGYGKIGSIAGTVDATSNINLTGFTELSAVRADSFSERVTWNGALVNHFADTRSFQVLLGASLRLTSGEPMLDYVVKADGAVLPMVQDQLSLFPSYTIGSLAPGQSRTVSVEVSYDFDNTVSSTPYYGISAPNPYTQFLRYAATPVAAVPEPGTVALWAAGLGALGLYRRRRTRSREVAPRLKAPATARAA